MGLLTVIKMETQISTEIHPVNNHNLKVLRFGNLCSLGMLFLATPPFLFILSINLILYTMVSLSFSLFLLHINQTHYIMPSSSSNFLIYSPSSSSTTTKKLEKLKITTRLN